MCRSVLIDLYNANLDYARRLLEGVDDDASIVQPAPGVNHPRWIIGHLAGTADRVTGKIGLDLVQQYDDDFYAYFGIGSEPKADGSVYPPLDDLLERLTQRHEANIDALRDAPEDLFGRTLGDDVPERFRARFPTVGHVLLYTMAAHEQMHLGQLSTWRRVRGLGCV